MTRMSYFEKSEMWSVLSNLPLCGNMRERQLHVCNYGNLQLLESLSGFESSMGAGFCWHCNVNFQSIQQRMYIVLVVKLNQNRVDRELELGRSEKVVSDSLQEYV